MDDSKLKLESIVCLVCQEILIKPVKLPCGHLVCLDCLQKIIENSNLTCPMCRRRLSHFLRKNKDYSLLVDKNLWKQIQNLYNKEVNQKLSGQDDGVWDSVILDTTPLPARQMYTPGELKAEYTRLQEQARAERERQEQEEQAKSLALIQQLEREEQERREEEEKQRMLREKQDEEYAKSLLQMEQEDQQGIELVESPPMTRSQMKNRNSLPASHRSKIVTKRKSTSSVESSRMSSTLSGKGTTGPIDMFCIRTTSPSMFAQTPQNRKLVPKSKSAQKRKSTVEGPLDRFYVRDSSATKRRCTTSPSRCSSPDSIESEMNYFKPIKLVPRTPPKTDQWKPIVVFPKYNVSSSHLNNVTMATPGSNQPAEGCTSASGCVIAEDAKNSDVEDVEMSSETSHLSVTNMNSTNHNHLDNPDSLTSNSSSPNSTLSLSKTNSNQHTPIRTFNMESKLVFNSPSHWSRSLFSGSQNKDKEPCAIATDNSDSIKNNLDQTNTPKKGVSTVPNVLKVESYNETENLAQSNGTQSIESSLKKPSQSNVEANNELFTPGRTICTPKRPSKNNRKTDHLPSPGKSSGHFSNKISCEPFSSSNHNSTLENSTESLRNKREIEHFFCEFKKISLHQAEGCEEPCFSQMLKQGVSSARSQRSCFIQSDDETDVESDFFPSPMKPTVVK